MALSRLNRKSILLTVLLAAPFAVWVWNEVAKENQKTDGTLYVALPVPFYNLDVLGSSGLMQPEMTIMNNLLMERLFTLGPTGDILPELGLHAEPSGDATTWDITLRQGVVFHDGSPFNADAVVHHWGRILDPENAFRGRAFIAPLKAVQKVDDHTVRFVLKHPWAAFLSVISDEVYTFAYIPSPAAVDAGSHGETPVGTGPFRFDKWNKGDHFSVARFDRYRREGEPYLEKIVFRHIPDPQTRYAALIADQVDAITVDRGAIIQRALNNEELTVFPTRGSGAEIVLLNTSRPPLDDRRVRRALALANNQALHVRMVYRNSIPLVEHPLGDGFDCPEVDYPAHDIQAARQLMADYGQPVAVECLHSNTLRGRQSGELLQQLFDPIGVALKPVGINPGGVIMKVVEKDYQMTTWRILSARDHGAYLYRAFHSRSPGNWSGYHSAALDVLLDAQLLETDPDRRRQIMCDIAAHLNTEAVVLYRGGRRFHTIAKKKVNGLASAGEMVDLSSAWIRGRKDNPWARRNELDAKDPVDCSDPGDIEAVRQAILGPWRGKDAYGAVINVRYSANGTVEASRGSRGGTAEYTICGDTVFFRPPGALLVMKLENGVLNGHWEYSGYQGTFTLERLAAETAAAGPDPT
jgi:ABC-type transport system substrate-binding protein